MSWTRTGIDPDGSSDGSMNARSVATRLAGPAITGVVVWVVLVALLVLCGEGIKHSAGIESVDRRITTFVVAHRTPALNDVMKFVTWTGSWIAVLVVAAIVALLAWRRRLPALAVGLVVAAWIGEFLAVTITKAIVARDRPPEPVRLVVAHGWSFPSGHTANAVVVFATAAGLAAAFAGSSYARLLIWAAAVIAIALVGFSRIELGVHWTTDVLASIVWTTIWILMVWGFWRSRSRAREAVTDGLSAIVRADGQAYAGPMASAETQEPRPPDALEQLRAARGEGWQWPRIQQEPCPQCGFNPASLPPETLGDHAVELAAKWRDFLVNADDGYLRTIPEPGVNSPLQYAAHVRDILMVYGDRMVLAVEADNPTVPIFNPPQEVWEAYNRLDAGELAADIEARAARLDEIVEGMDESAWSRIVINDRGQYGVYTFTVAGLARNAVHEAHHHLLDAKGTLAMGAMP